MEGVLKDLNLGSMALKKTTTRVRKRDGTIHYERDGETMNLTSGDGVAAVDARHESSIPQYVLDQEAGISRIPPKYYDAKTKRWVSGYPQVEEFPSGTPDKHVVLRCLTFNVWFDEKHQRRRSDSLCEILAESQADIICLQEVTPIFLSWLRDKSFCRQHYFLSDSIGTTLKGTFAYGVVMLVRIRPDLILREFSLHAVPTQMNRSALVASIAFRGVPLRIATVHLESLDNVALRVAQLKVVTHALSCGSTEELLEASTNKLDSMACESVVGASATSWGGANVTEATDEPTIGSNSLHDCFLLGDMNFNDDAVEETAAIRDDTNRSWKDSWIAVEGQDSLKDPENCATMRIDDIYGKPTRIDRIFHSSGVFKPRRIKRIGMEAVVQVLADRTVAGRSTEQFHGQSQRSDESSADALASQASTMHYPSDHFGLLCEFEVASESALEEET